MKAILEKRYTEMEINDVVSSVTHSPQEFVDASEEYYNHQVMSGALRIKQGMGRYKFVLLCGPSASGKTTTAHKLKHRLISTGIGASVLSMDDFFKGIQYYPTLPDGKPDMESVENLDMDLLNSCFEELMESGRSMFPVFDFAAQKPIHAAHSVELGKNDVLIMEGIHALNPMVLRDVPRENIFRIYVSVRTKFMNGEETVLVPKDIRLMRRMVRDYKFRNYPPLRTLAYWTNVTAGERANIDPYRDNVDLKMDNTIDYEVCVWHELLKDLMESINIHDFDDYPQLNQIFNGLVRFPRVDYRLIPQNSLLREFIG